MSGGKADNLRRLKSLGFPVPEWIVIGPDEAADEAALAGELAAAGLSGDFFAVRSSASAEDGALASFAGQFETLLAVPRAKLSEAVAQVRASVGSDAVLAYCRENGVAAEALRMSVVVQEMAAAEKSGVAFAVDFKTGSRKAVTVSAVRGLGEGLVSELAEADTYVEKDGMIEASLSEKIHAVRFAPGGGTTVSELSPEERDKSVLSDEEARRVAEAARKISRAFGRPQDVEWALTADGKLWILQTRPITTLSKLPDPDEESVLWDNSNIVESYPGVTLPLTFSFARTVYSAVYRQLCFALGVERALVDANPDAFEMLGHWKGRFYYNLRNWYRVLMMLPGYRVNAGFMETMMGVKEPLREKPSIRPSRRPEWLRVCSTIIGVACQALTLDSRVKAFMRRFDEVVTPLEERDLGELSCAELAALYDDLQREFVAGWRTPLANDFFAMIAYGSLKKSLVKWGVDAGGSMQNDILVGIGDIVSAEPMRRLAALAELVRGDAELKKALASGDAAAFTAEIPNHPVFESEWKAYLKKFGPRCMGELKLETVTYDMDPEPLVAMLRGYAAAPLPLQALPKEPDLSALKGHPLRRILFKLLRSRARRYVSNRENLRFERTRLFAVIRRIMLAFGARLLGAGFLDAPRDVFYLEMPEVLGFALGCADPGTFRELVAGRKALFAKYEKEPALPERFETRGGVIVPRDETPSGPDAAPESDGTLKGLGCCRGVVRGKATVIRDLSCAGDTAGRILVAERTDPGWGPLFPLAKGVLVERGSVLSHAAILTRELGIPCVVGVKGLLSAVATGDEIELDGAAGTVRLIAKGGA